MVKVKLSSFEKVEVAVLAVSLAFSPSSQDEKWRTDDRFHSKMKERRDTAWMLSGEVSIMWQS